MGTNGGAVYILVGSNATFIECVFVSNTVRSPGGAHSPGGASNVSFAL